MNQGIAKGLVSAGLANVVGVLLVSRGFTHPYVGTLFPELFSSWGLACIILWGLAYLSVARSWRQAPALLAVFAVEKALYVGSWVWWQSTHGGLMPQIWATDPLTGLFYAAYGPLDLAYGLYFASLCVQARRG